ncbi:MAG: flagellar motor switch protein FliM [Candidatus Loosdrechtia sp.]|uniref:flagellar motor switch protein FliM n=1 Tax=Candidatus Loosdrechtia sp. TaxID=3101272 RepID=UPI003A79BC7A|nr:MAG: FliM/FliN family flagellar motor switch protein [Candidatus Jettenia sp. AMX2]
MENKDHAILSTEEVERLLDSFREDQATSAQTEIFEDEDGRIKYYDFKRPNILSREKKNILYKLYDNTAYQISREISNYLRTTIKVDVKSIDELSFEIFKNTCPDIVFINIIGLKPLQGYGCVAIDIGLCLAMVARAFGGTDKTQNKIRKLTEMETAIIKKIVNIIVEKFSGSWKAFTEMKSGVSEAVAETGDKAKPGEWYAGRRISDTIMESKYLDIASEAEAMLLVSFIVNLEYSSGEMKLCLPVSSMESILEQLHNRNKPSEQGVRNDSKENEKLLRKVIHDINVVVAGVLDETNITVNDLISLKVGDVLRLDNKITNNIKVSVEGKNKYYGKPGLSGSKKAIQIVTLIDNVPVSV